jgi:endonuclease/exonuclease/phosphatase family metal-dependent hydrolase
MPNIEAAEPQVIIRNIQKNEAELVAKARLQLLQVVTWNVGLRRSSVLDALSQYRPDILTAQEVRVEHADAFRERLVAAGLRPVHYTGNSRARSKRYGNVIASRWPMDTVELQYKKRPPWPRLLACVSISVGGRRIIIITAHIPNGSGNGWAKIDTFFALAELVCETRGHPCVVTGDFNEPQLLLQDDRIVTWGQEQDCKGRFVCWDYWRFAGRSGTGEQWDSAVRWLFEKREEHELRHAYWQAHGHGAMDITHLPRGQPRWFDHMFVSTHFRVESCGYLHDVRRRGGSDHSALRATLRIVGGELMLEADGLRPMLEPASSADIVIQS